MLDKWCVCVGQSGDTSSTVAQIICLKLDGSGKLLMKKLYSHQENQYGYSLAIKKNGDFIIGGNRVGGPLLMQTDSLENIKWSTWFYDSVAYKLRLQNSATINSLRETSRGTIICAAGDPYPNNNGQVLNNYAAILEFDSLGNMHHYREFNNVTGYNIGGFYVDETQGKNFVLSGNQGVLYTDTVDYVLWQKNYTFMLTGVGSETNNISRAKVLRDNNLIVPARRMREIAGQRTSTCIMTPGGRARIMEAVQTGIGTRRESRERMIIYGISLNLIMVIWFFPA